MADSTLAPVKAAPALTERGYAATPTSRTWWSAPTLDAETTPELRWPESLAVFDAMVRQDAQVASVLRAVTHPIRGTGWRLDPNGAADEVVQHVALDLGLPIRGREDAAPGRLRDRFSWSDHLRHALLVLRYGHMPFEQTYRVGADGRLHLRKLGPRMPRSIARFNVAADGGLISLEQHPSGDTATVAKPIVLPVSRLVVYTHEREGGNWAGTSLLRPAYKNWLVKDRLLRVQAQAVDRNGMGIPAYTAPENATPEDITAGLSIASAIRAGDNSGASIPNGAKLELLGVQGAIPNADTPIRYHDEQIGKSVLAHFLNLGQRSGTGSYALADVLAGAFLESLHAVAQDIATVATAHIVEDLVDLNWGPDEPAPRIVFDEIGSATGALAAAIKTLVDAGVLSPDEGLEAHVRLGLGLPTKTDDQPDPQEVPDDA